MPTSTHLDDLKINVLTESQFDAAVQGGVIGAGEISMITDLDEAIQTDTLPTAAATELGKIYQFTGATDASYTHGYFYECVSDGQPTPTYSWSQVNVQPAGSVANTITVSDTIPTADSTQVGKVYQYMGTTNSNYKKGCFYYCYESQGAYYWGLITPIKDADLIGPSINSMSFGIGATVRKTNNTVTNSSVAIGPNAICNLGSNSTAVGSGAQANTDGVAVGRGASAATYAVSIGSANSATNYSVAIGYNTGATASGAIQIGPNATNSEASTVKICLKNGNSYPNYKLLDSDGTIPADRFTTTPSADGTYVPTLTISSGVATRSWAAPSGGGSTALSLTLAAANWSNNSITVTATGVTASNNVIVSPAPASQSAYTTAGVMCTAQAADSLTFTCTTTPSSDLTVTVLII